MKEVYQFLNELVTSLGNELDRLNRPIQNGYIVEGTLNQIRTLDVDNATLDELRKFVGQLAQDMKDRGDLG